MKHLDGTAFDIAMANHDPATFEAAAREVLAQSRTLRGTGAAGVATIRAAGVEVAQDVLAEAQGSILPLVPYLDTLRWGVHRPGAGGDWGRHLGAGG